MSNLMSPANSALLYRQMAAAARNRLPFVDLFSILTEDPELLDTDAPVASLMHQSLGEGRVLSEAMASLPKLFEVQTMELIKHGEAHGQLAEILEALASEQSDLAQSASAARTALAWPSVLLLFALTIFSVIMIFVVPAFKEVFSNFGAELPAPTLLLIGVSDFFVRFWYWIAAVVVGVMIARRRKLVPVFWSLQMERLWLAVPFVCNYTSRVFGAQLMRWFALCHTSPALLELALRHVQATTKWLVFRGLLEELVLRLCAGKGLGEALDRLPLLPRRLGLQIRLGEKTGTIGDSLAQALEVAELEQAHALIRYERGVFLTAYLTIGLFVGFAVIAMYLPIFKLGQVV